MRKRYLVSVFAVICACFIASLVQAEQKRIYNDGVIDYVPLQASIVLSAEDSDSLLREIQYGIDGSELKTYDGPISFDTEGRHVIVYRAVDQAGNISNEKIYSVIVDGTPPEERASIIGPVFRDGERIYITTQSAFVLTADDSLSGVDAVYVQIDGGGFVPYAGPIQLTDEGFHETQTFAVDNVGNVSEEMKVEGYVDASPPEVRMLASEDLVVVDGKNYTNRNNQFIVEASDELSGMRNIYVSIDRGEYTEYAGPFRVQTAGEHVLRAWASDNLGNRSEPVELSFFVDVVPPESRLGASVE